MRRLLAAVIFVTVCAGPARADVIDRILAVVSGGLVLQSDAEAAIHLGLVTLPAAGDRLQGALDRLIERRLMLIEVDRYGPPEPSLGEIDAGVREIDQRVGSGERMDAILRAAGFTVDQLRLFVRDDLRIRAYLQQRFGTTESPDRRATLVREWLAGLRRRAEVNVLYLPK